LDDDIREGIKREGYEPREMSRVIRTHNGD
jgi:hypothetical protein